MSQKDEQLDNNEALLKSLESIKELLAKSENKLSAARESLDQANQGSKMKKKEPEIDIPVLDEVVEPGQQFELGIPDDIEEETQESIIEEIDIEATEPTMMINETDLPFDVEERDDITQEPEEEIVPDVILQSEPPTPAPQEAPDLTNVLKQIDELEHSLRQQAAITAKVFEDQINKKLDERLKVLREEVHALVERFGG